MPISTNLKRRTERKNECPAPPVVWERRYGGYPVKICFAEHPTPGAETRLLDAILASYCSRIEKNP